VGVAKHPEGKKGNQAREFRFDHSSLFGFPLSRQDLAGTTKPKLSRKGKAERFILGRLNGENAIADLENEFVAGCSDYFPSTPAASAFLREIVKRISQCPDRDF